MATDVGTHSSGGGGVTRGRAQSPIGRREDEDSVEPANNETGQNIHCHRSYTALLNTAHNSGWRGKRRDATVAPGGKGEPLRISEATAGVDAGPWAVAASKG